MRKVGRRGGRERGRVGRRQVRRGGQTGRKGIEGGRQEIMGEGRHVKGGRVSR